MSFSSVLFLAVFLPATLALYWLLPRRRAVQNGVLLAASYLFFASWGPSALPVLLAATGVNYALLRALRARGADGLPSAARPVLVLGLGYNLGQLFLLKYLGFFAGTVEALAALGGGTLSLPAVHLLLPIGLSFWTLQLCAYLVDVAYGRRPPPESLLDYALFAAFFPQIVSGPIPRGELLDQMQQPRHPAAEAFARGGFAFLLGYTLKFLVAGTVSGVVDPVYAAPARYDAASHWLALYAYAMQIFGDFAGYSLMAIGLAECFGLRLMENFRFPFLARNISDFWKRWHISLTTLLFDYIYTPLVTGSGWMRGRLAAGLFVVLLVSGLWHGATWMFVLWGGLHGLALVVAHRWDEQYRGWCRKDRRWVARRKSRSYVLVAWALTQLWFLFSLIPFRAPDLATAGQFLAGLFGAGGGERVPLGVNISASLNMLVCLAFVVLYHAMATAPGQKLAGWLWRTPAPLRGVAYGLLVVYLFLFKPLSEGAFIYAQF